jgi:hypothetical protein
VSDAPLPLPAFTAWPTFPFEGDLRVKKLADPVDEEPPRHGEDPAECSACRAPDSAYIWISERWRVRSLDRPTGLPMVLILESRSHLDMGDLTNLLAAELGVLTVRLERAIRSLDDVARVHVNRWGDGSAHLHVWFLARPVGRLQLRGTFLSLWDDILPRIPEAQWRENLAHVAAWLADFGGEALAEPPHIDWQSPAQLNIPSGTEVSESEPAALAGESDDAPDAVGMGSSVVAAETAELTRELHIAAAPVQEGVTTAAVSRETEKTVNLTGATAGETVRIPTARTTGGETVNLADVRSGETIRFPVETTSTTTGESGEATAGSPTMRFGTSGVSGSGTQTMVFPTGDAMAAARAEAGNGSNDNGSNDNGSNDNGSNDNAGDDPELRARSKS